MGNPPRLISNWWKARLSRRIVFWVFLSIVAIEAIILVPSVMRRERELLDYLRSLSAAQGEGILSGQPELATATDVDVLAALEALQANQVVLGGALYRADRTRVGTFGEAPALDLATALARRQQRGRGDRYYRRGHRYDALWTISPLADQYHLIIRHDATWVGREFYYFIARITGLVVIISIFVTGATLIVLDRLVIASILALRRDLRRAGETLRCNQDVRSLLFESVRLRTGRRDELGDVILTFEEMVNKAGEAIAERNQAEADLRLSEEKFSKAFYASPNPMTLSTLSGGHLLEVNDSFLDLYGADRSAVVGKTSTQLGVWANPGDRNQMQATLQQQGYLRNQEYVFHTAQGDQRTLLVSADILSLNGEPCILAVANDITERKAAEEALRESEQRFRALVEQATDALFVVDTNGRFLDVNQQACRTLGYSREELLQRSVPDVQKQVSLDDLSQDLSLPSNQPITREGVHQRKDGSRFPVEVRLGRIELQGRPALLALARDISERKQAEQAQARLAEIGELAAMIVHEVRNPLTTILMGLQAFERMDLPERARLRLTFALEESQRLQRLLNEILLYAREQTLQLHSLALGSFLQTLCDEFGCQPVAYQRQIHYQGPETGPRVQADRDRLKQVFINLLSNACEAVPEGETITCRLWTTAASANVQIHNGGEPIPAEILPRLTRPFFTTKSSGNGLGLAITRRIVEAHGGHLSITSTAAEGTITTVELPLQSQQAVSSCRDTVSPSP